MKFQNVSPENIEVTLQSLMAGGWERLPALDDNSKAIMPSPAAVVAASADRSAMQREIEVLRKMLDRADQRADAAIAAAKADHDELLARLHRAELKLELYESGELKPKTPGS